MIGISDILDPLGILVFLTHHELEQQVRQDVFSQQGSLRIDFGIIDNRSRDHDEIEIVPHLGQGGAQAVLFMQCVKYGDRWYNGELSGLPGAILGLPFNSAGMVVEGVTDYGVDLSALNNPLALLTQTEGTRLFNANAKSDLAGTRWQLERVDGADVAVKADAGAAAQDGLRHKAG